MSKLDFYKKKTRVKTVYNSKLSNCYKATCLDSLNYMQIRLSALIEKEPQILSKKMCEYT